ncbi:WD repeat-containing protein 54-like isoform X2 [Paramacrobiotus metropolitanus]|nr:WD repeat-containing protein 54-like isoform X2 [Paramacrobiotus metropolitanus]
MPTFNYKETIFLPYSVSLLQNNLSVINTDDKQFEYALVHKFGVVTGNQESSADVLKKPWSTSTAVPTGALVLSIVIFQIKIFPYNGKTVLIALSTHGPYIAFGEELEPIPSFTIEEIRPNTEWSMYISVGILGEDVICMGNCHGQIQILQIQAANKENIVPLNVLQTTSRSKILLLRTDPVGLVAVDSLGKLWSWTVEKEPALKGVPVGLTALTNCMELTEAFIVLGFSNGSLRLFFRESGCLYCEAYAHASAITAMTFCPKSSVLLSVGEDSYVRVWQLHEELDNSKFQHVQNTVVEDMRLCGVQFLNVDGSHFGVVGYDRNELVIFSAT